MRIVMRYTENMIKIGKTSNCLVINITRTSLPVYLVIYQIFISLLILSVLLYNINNLIVVFIFTIIVIFFIFSVLWQLFGEVMLRIENQRFILKKKLFNYTYSKEFNLDSILNIWRKKPIENIFEIVYIYCSFNIFSNIGTIDFELKDNGNRNIELGGFLNEDETLTISKELIAYLSRYRKFEIPYI